MWPWDLVENLPFLVGLIVQILVVAFVVVGFCIPVVMMARSEPADLRVWMAGQRRRIAWSVEQGLRGGPLFMRRLAYRIDVVNQAVGKVTAWAALFMVLIQFGVVIARYVFSVGSIQMQESVWYMHGLLFLMGAGFTLLHDGHVRVDIFYREASPRYKAVVDLVGVVAFLTPVCFFAWDLAWPYVMNSWAVLEGSREVQGLPWVYLAKTVILFFLVLLWIQGVSLALKSLLVLLGHEEPADGAELHELP